MGCIGRKYLWWERMVFCGVVKFIQYDKFQIIQTYNKWYTPGDQLTIDSTDKLIPFTEVAKIFYQID
jgi:hypothetical protein